VNERGKVMDIHGGVDAENRQMIMWGKHGKLNQQFDIIYVDEYPEEPGKGELNEDFGLYVERPFYIVSQMPDHRYLDLIDNRNFVIKTPNARKTQTWWFDQKSLTIKTKLNNQSWDIKNAGRTNNMQIWSTNSGWFQIFKYVDEHFINIQDGRALDVHGGKDEEGRQVIVWKKHNGANQRWTIIYLDKAEKVQSEGLNTEFGFHCNRPFYIVSRLPMRRVAESIGANNITIRRWRKNQNMQQWTFNCADKTIRNNHWKNYAMEIQSNGGSSNLRTTSAINSRWW
jgi:hypothetical protein